MLGQHPGITLRLNGITAQCPSVLPRLLAFSLMFSYYVPPRPCKSATASVFKVNCVNLILDEDELR